MPYYTEKRTGEIINNTHPESPRIRTSLYVLCDLISQTDHTIGGQTNDFSTWDPVKARVIHGLYPHRQSNVLSIVENIWFSSCKSQLGARKHNYL
jgi:hypothetical protein